MESVFLSNFLLDGQNGWFTLRGWEGLFHVNLETGICDCEENIVKENLLKNTDTIFKYKNFIFLLPTNEGNTIDIFDIQKREYAYHIKLNLTGKCYFDNALAREDCIYFINNWSSDSAIYVLDMKEANIIRKISINSGLLWKYNSPGRLFSKDIIVEGNTLILASSTEQYIIKVELCSGIVSYINIPCKLKGFAAICSDGKNYWMTDEDALVIKWNHECVEREYNIKDIVNLNTDLSESEIEYRNSTHGYRASYMYFNSTIYKSGSIFWIPGRADKLLKLDLLSEEWETVCLMPEIQGFTSWLLYPILKKECIYLYSVREQKLICIDTQEHLRRKEIAFNLILENKTIWIENGLLYENALFTLNDFVKNDFKIIAAE